MHKDLGHTAEDPREVGRSVRGAVAVVCQGVTDRGDHAGRRIARHTSVDDRLLVGRRLSDAGRLDVADQSIHQVVVGPRRPLADGPVVTSWERWVDTSTRPWR